MFELRLIHRLAQAIEAPRIRIPEFGGGAGSIPEPYAPPVNTATGESMSEDDAGLTMQIEARVPEDVRAALMERGHLLEVQENWTAAVGGMQGVRIDPENGTLSGGADPRRDGYAIGW